MHNEYERRQESRRKHHSSLRFNLDTCKGYLWYKKALAAELMMESRREVERPSPVELEDPPLTTSESVTSEENLVCRNAPETLTQAHAAGIPVDTEQPATSTTTPAETAEDRSESVSEQISPDISQDLAA
jgi:hypothetical protein